MALRMAIFGATGMVGRELIRVLHKREFPFASLRVFASERSAGKQLDTPWGEKTIELADTADFNEFDLAFFAIGGGWPKKFAPRAVEAGCMVVDNSSTFRYDDSVPLVVPEINPGAIGDSKLIANPNCTTAIAAIPLWHIHTRYGLQKVIISTYQATSGAGNGGMAELEQATRRCLTGEEPGCSVFKYPIAFNLIPHIDSFQENQYTREEMKVVWETRKIFADQTIPISCTCVRIPTMRAHAESIVVETREPVDPDELRATFADTPGIVVRDDIDNCVYPMPLTASEQFDVEVGRIRRSLIFGDYGIEFFVCGDQILKGAALNAVQIGELLLKKI